MPDIVIVGAIPEIPSTPTNLTVIMLAERIHERVYIRGIHNGQ